MRRPDASPHPQPRAWLWRAAWTLVLFVPFAVLARRSDDLGAVFLAPGAWLMVLVPAELSSSSDFYQRAFWASCALWPAALLVGVLVVERAVRRFRAR